MANRKSSITAELKLAGLSQFKSGLSDAGKSARMTGQQLSAIPNAMGSGGMRFTELNSKMQILGGAARTAGSIFKSAFGKDLNVEQLAMALSSVSDGTESLSSQFAALKEAAKLPGLGFKEIAKGSLDLQSVGVSAQASRDIIIQFGNALASTGKGKAELDGITTALSQIYGKGKVSAEEINQIAERYPAIRAISADLDKSSPSKFTEGLTDALSKLPRATGTAQDALDNLGDAYEQLSTTATGGDLNNMVKNIAQAAADALASGDMSGMTEAFTQSLEKGISSTLNEDLLSKYELPPEEAAKRQKIKADGLAAEEAARQKLLDTELEIGDKERALADAKKDNDDELVLSLSKELELLKDKEKLMATIGISEQQATEHIEKRVTAEIQGANRVRDAERAKNQAKGGRELSELEAKSGGMSDRKFKKLQKSNRLADEQERLIGEGYTPEQAKERAGRIVGAESRIAENEDRAARGLRPRSRTVTDPAERERNRFNRLSSGDKEKLESLSHSESAQETFSRKQAGGINAGADDRMGMRQKSSNLMEPIKGVGSDGKDKSQKTEGFAGVPLPAFDRNGPMLGGSGLDNLYGAGGASGQSDGMEAFQPPSGNERKTIKGAGNKGEEKKSGSNDKPDNLYQITAKGFASLEKAIRDNGPNAADRAKPTSSTK